MRIVYLDSSAIVKRVLSEPESEPLRRRLAELATGANELVTSTLGWVEVSRTLRRRLAVGDVEYPGDAESDALAGVSGYPISYETIAVARRIGGESLRTLDAIHCATATMVGAASLVSYDRRLIESASSIGIPVEAPGFDLA